MKLILDKESLTSLDEVAEYSLRGLPVVMCSRCNENRVSRVSIDVNGGLPLLFIHEYLTKNYVEYDSRPVTYLTVRVIKTEFIPSSEIKISENNRTLIPQQDLVVRKNIINKESIKT